MDGHNPCCAVAYHPKPRLSYHSRYSATISASDSNDKSLLSPPPPFPPPWACPVRFFLSAPGACLACCFRPCALNPSSSSRINYIYLFDMDPRAVSSPLQVFNNVAAETVVYLANLLLYYKVRRYRRLFDAVPMGNWSAWSYRRVLFSSPDGCVPARNAPTRVRPTLFLRTFFFFLQSDRVAPSLLVPIPVSLLLCFLVCVCASPLLGDAVAVAVSRFALTVSCREFVPIDVSTLSLILPPLVLYGPSVAVVALVLHPMCAYCTVHRGLSTGPPVFGPMVCCSCRSVLLCERRRGQMLMHRFPPIVPAGCLPLLLCFYVISQARQATDKQATLLLVFVRVLSAVRWHSHGEILPSAPSRASCVAFKVLQSTD